MIRTVLMLALIALPAGACASAGTTGAENAGPVVVEPAGRYDISVEVGGESRTGSLDVSSDGDEYDGRLQIPGLPPAAITGARVLSARVVELEWRSRKGSRC